MFVGLGVTKLRITGGEPLLRRDLEVLIAQLATLGDLDLTLTTNGALLAKKAQALADAGLTRVTVSLDSLDDEVFRAMNDVDFPVARVLGGIDGAAEAGLPVKVNVVVKRGLNDGSVLDIARRFRGTGHTVRFIEFMDVGATNGWKLDDVVPAAEIVRTIGAEFPLEPVEAAYRGEVAERYRYLDGEGEIGVIASVTQPFCGDCTRARISADGKLYTCLFSLRGHDLRSLLRSTDGDDGSSRRSARSGSAAPTATRSCARRRRAPCARSRCHTSAARRFRSAETPRRPRLGSRGRALARTMSATAPTTAAPAINVCSVISSPRRIQARITATTGLTYAYVATSEIGAARRSQTYALNPMNVPATMRYPSASTPSVVNRASPSSPSATDTIASSTPPHSEPSPADTNGRRGRRAPRA